MINKIKQLECLTLYIDVENTEVQKFDNSLQFLKILKQMCPAYFVYITDKKVCYLRGTMGIMVILPLEFWSW